MAKRLKSILTEAATALYVLALFIGTLLLISDVPVVKIAGLGLILACVLVGVIWRGGEKR